MSGALPTREIGSSAEARGTRVIDDLGFVVVQCRVVRLENREWTRGRGYVSSGDECKEENTRQGSCRHAE